MASSYKEHTQMRAVVMKVKRMQEEQAIKYLTGIFKQNMKQAVKVGVKLGDPEALADEIDELTEIALNEVFTTTIETPDYLNQKGRKTTKGAA